jgi:hypothetical protein
LKLTLQPAFGLPEYFICLYYAGCSCKLPAYSFEVINFEERVKIVSLLKVKLSQSFRWKYKDGGLCYFKESSNAIVIMNKQLQLLTIAILLITRCDRRQQNTDKFYSYHGDWDITRIPFIKPYEAIRLNGTNNWTIGLNGDSSIGSIYNVKRAIVINKMIIVQNENTFKSTTNSILSDNNSKPTWYILIPALHIEKGFLSHTTYINFLYSHNVKREPILYKMSSIIDYYKDRDTIEWENIPD